MNKTEFSKLTAEEKLLRTIMGHPSVEDHYTINAHRARNMMYSVNEKVAREGGVEPFDDDMLEAITEFVLRRSEANKTIRWDDEIEAYVFAKSGKRIDEI